MEKNKINLMLGNFETLPYDVIEMLLLSLSPSDMLTVCSTNSKFKAICKRGALNKAALKYLQENTPISEPITSFTQQANLVKKGFKTYYNLYFTITDNHWETRDEIQFLSNIFSPDDMRELQKQNVRLTYFSIAGFPGKSGTLVHIAYLIHFGESYAFLNPEAAFDFLIQYDLREYVDGPDEEIFKRLMDREVLDDGGYAIISLPLP